MKLPVLFVSMSFVLFGGAAASAQMCGKYQVSLTVLDERNKPLNDAEVRLLPITKDETLGKRFVRDGRDASKFTIEYLEGQSLKEFHRLIVSAAGYRTARMPLRFYSCRRLPIAVNLPRAKSSAAPIWKPNNKVAFYLADEEDRQLAKVKISIFKDGALLRTMRSKIGGSGTALDFGKYVFKFEKKGYRTEESAVDLTGIENPLGISRRLKRRRD